MSAFRKAKVDRVLLTTREVGDVIARSQSEVRKLVQDDATFPRSFTLRPGGDPVWDSTDVYAWIDRRKLLTEDERRRAG